MFATKRLNRLDEARAELAIIESALIELATAKTQASVSSGAFAAWRQEQETKLAERERLQIQIETLEREAAAAGAADRIEQVRKRHAVKMVENEKLANRIRSELSKANAAILQIIREVAQSMIEDQAINSELLPDDLEPIISADAIARSQAGLPRKELSRKRLSLWVRQENHAPISDQETVRDLGNGYGIIERPHVADVRCIRMPFEQLTFHPAEPAARARPVWQTVIMQPDGPRVLFDGIEIRQPREVLAALDRATAPREPRARPVETDIRPVDASKSAN